MIPATWRRAQEMLGMRVVGAVPERMRRDAVGEQASRDFPITATAAGDLHWSPVVTVGDQEFPVTSWLLERWRTDPQTLLAEAFAASHRRVTAERFTLRNAGPGCWRTGAAEHPAWLLRPEFVTALLSKGLRTPGEPILLVATAGSAILAGADDPVGLATMAELAEQELHDHPLAAVSAQPLRWQDGWTPFDWPTGAGARRRDRGIFQQLTAAVSGLRGAFDDACATVAQTVRRDGLPIRRVIGRATRDETVLDGWEQLAFALGATADEAADVRSAAVDSLTWFDTRATQLRGFDSPPGRDEFRPQHVLAGALNSAGLLLVVHHKDDPVTVAADLAAVPVVQATGFRPVLAGDYDSVGTMAEDLSTQLRTAGVKSIAIDSDGDALWLVPVTAAQSDRVGAALRQIGGRAPLTYF